ncbi:MAG: lipopolysaccharide core heptose(I) kinase RfaP [Halioglobus sp.]
MADEYYVRSDLLGEVQPDQLLPWGRDVAQCADSSEVYRDKEGRKTLRFRAINRSFFLKLHSGIGWREVFKNLLQLRLPVTGAQNEYHAIRKLESLGVDTLSVAAYAQVGLNPAHKQSLLVTDDLVGTISLEDFCANWSRIAPSSVVRRRIIHTLASMSRAMHDAGINHRDYYLCHFHLDLASLEQAQLRCHLIDLHRAQMRKVVPKRWRIKDLAGLYFSAMDCGICERDLLRFVAAYSGQSLRVTLRTQRKLWAKVRHRALGLYRQEHGREPPAL